MKKVKVQMDFTSVERSNKSSFVISRKEYMDAIRKTILQSAA